ncbi:MAG: tRNA dihydrouridine synthase DusB [Candidatus Flexifilum sp.]|jgi:nifR3 family TIM-barrel protein
MTDAPVCTYTLDDAALPAPVQPAGFDPGLIYDLKPIHIGGIAIETPLTLAPMAGQTGYALRTLAREIGDCGLVCTELLSSHAIHYRNSKTERYFDWHPDEHPFAVQLFGSDPAIMAEAAAIVVELGAPIVDINMGCWVPKVAGKGAGAALLKDVKTAAAMVRAIVRAVNVPVTVKVRTGWDARSITAVEFARAAEAEGAQAIAVHARTAEQGFSGEPDWDIIRQVKEAVTRIPVIGNGDVTSAADAVAMLRQTGCDGVMIGRGALGRPWIFHHIAHALRTGEILPPPTPQERARLCLRHARLTLERGNLDPAIAVRELRGQLTKYHLGVPGAARLRDQLVRAETLADIEALLLPVIEGQPAV